MFIIAFAAAYVTLASLEAGITESPPGAERIANFICESDIDAARAGIYFADRQGIVATGEMESRFVGRCSYRSVEVRPPGASVTDVIPLGKLDLHVVQIRTAEGYRWMFQLAPPSSQSLKR